MYECLYVCLHIVVNVCLKGWGCARISVSPYVCVCLHMRVSSMSMHMLAHACLKHVYACLYVFAQVCHEDRGHAPIDRRLPCLNLRRPARSPITTPGLPPRIHVTLLSGPDGYIFLSLLSFQGRYVRYVGYVHHFGNVGSVHHRNPPLYGIDLQCPGLGQGYLLLGGSGPLRSLPLLLLTTIIMCVNVCVCVRVCVYVFMNESMYVYV